MHYTAASHNYSNVNYCSITVLLREVIKGRMTEKKTKGKETIGYAERVSERVVVCGTKEKGRKQERVENNIMEAKNLPNRRTLTTTVLNRLVSNISAAFDTIDHNLLLRRLSSWFGISGTALLWFKSYLS